MVLSSKTVCHAAFKRPSEHFLRIPSFFQIMYFNLQYNYLFASFIVRNSKLVCCLIQLGEIISRFHFFFFCHFCTLGVNSMYFFWDYQSYLSVLTLQAVTQYSKFRGRSQRLVYIQHVVYGQNSIAIITCPFNSFWW